MSTEFRYGPAAAHRDPEYISAMEHFESMTHAGIHEGTQKIDAGEIAHASLIWLEAAATLTATIPAGGSHAEKTIAQAGWQGSAADAAAVSVRSFAASVDELAAVFAEVGARLGAVAGAAEAVKLAVPPPGVTGPVGAIARALEAAHVLDAAIAEEVMRQEAILAMNMIYKPAYSAAASGVLALPNVPESSDSAPAATAPRPHSPHPPQTPSAPAQSGPAPAAAVPPPAATPPPATPAPGSSTPGPNGPSPTPAPETHTPPPPPAPAAPPPQAPSRSPAPPPAPAAPPPGSPPLADQGGQPGITGPIPDTNAPEPDQPGVSPPR